MELYSVLQEANSHEIDLAAKLKIIGVENIPLNFNKFFYEGINVGAAFSYYSGWSEKDEWEVITGINIQKSFWREDAPYSFLLKKELKAAVVYDIGLYTNIHFFENDDPISYTDLSKFLRNKKQNTAFKVNLEWEQIEN